MSEKELFKASNRPDGDLERVIIAAVDPSGPMESGAGASFDEDESLLELAELIRTVDGAVVGQVVQKRKKPDPYPVNLLMKKYGADRRETLLVGDSKYDMEAGYRAGVAKFFLTYGYAVRKEAEKWKPDFVSGSFADVLKVVSWKQ